MTIDSKTTPVVEKKSMNSFSNDALDPADMVRQGTGLDGVIWFVAIVLLIGATLVNQYLPQYVPMAASIWVRVSVIVGLVVVALFALYTTRQGKGFVLLLKDARTELHRITWASKEDTIKTSWIVLAVVLVVGLLLWALDSFFGLIIKAIIG